MINGGTDRRVLTRLLAVAATATVLLVLLPVGGARAAAREWRQVSAGDAHTCAIASTGRLSCWGLDDDGRLGLGDVFEPVTTPKPVGRDTWKQVSAGRAHTCGITTTERLYCWGDDASGQVGDGDDGQNLDRTTPTRIGSRTWASVSAGAGQTCAIDTDQRLWCWGDDTQGQVGVGGGGYVQSPTRIGAARWTAVSAGGTQTCGVTTPGNLMCWGTGATGTDPNQLVGTPTRVGVLRWRSVSVGSDHACGTTRSDDVRCWGGDGYGQVGDGPDTTGSTTPVDVGGQSTAVRLDAGLYLTCGVADRGGLRCWGDGTQSQLGNGDATGSDVPASAARGLTGWTRVSAGGSHVCGLRGTALYCWGAGGVGQLGTGSPANRSTPFRIR